MESTITLNQKVTNPLGQKLSFNSSTTYNVVLTAYPDGTATVTFEVSPELEDSFIKTLQASIGQV